MTQAVEILNNQAVEILNNMGRPLATLIGGSLLGGGLYLEHQTRETGREIHNNSCLTQDRKIQELFEQKRYHRADLLDARKQWDHLCFERMRDHGMVSTLARDLFDIPLTEENTFTKDERKRWEQTIEDLVKKEVIETREFDKAREIRAKKLIENQERAARVANFKSIPKTHIHRLLWEGIKMGYHEPLVQEGLQTLFQQLTSILIAKGTEAAVKKFEEVLSRGLDGEGAGRIGSPLEERSGYVNQFYTSFLTTFTSFQYYAEKELEELRGKYGDDLTREIISHHFILNPFLESEEYDYLLFKMQQEYEEQYNEDPSSFESGESSFSTFSEYGHSDEGASTSHPNDPANRPLRRTDSISDQKDLDLAEERKQKILLMEQNDKLKEQIREAALIEQKKKAADMYNRLREDSKKDTIKAHQPKDPDDSEGDDNYNPFTDKGKGKKKYF